jgi:hypothetical protein
MDINWGIRVISAFNIISSVIFVFVLIKNKKIVSALFLGLVLDLLLVIFIKYSLLNTDVTSWRSLYVNDSNMYLGLYYLNQSIIILKMGYKFFCNLSIKNNYSPECNGYSHSKSLAFLPNLLILFFILVDVLFVLIEGSVILGGREVWLTGRTSFPWVEVFYLNLLMSVIMIHVYKVRSVLSIILYSINIFITLYFAITGFRGILVFYVFCVFAIVVLKRNRITLKELRRVAVIALISIILLNVLSLVRTGTDSVQNLSEEFLSHFGLHEENIFTSFVGTLNQDKESDTVTYIDSILAIFPSGFFGNSYRYVRVNNLIGSIFFTNEQLNAGHNVGAFYLAEGVYNWGSLGVYISTIIYLTITVLSEKILRKITELRLAIYIIMCGNIYTGVYYGSATFVKMIFYELILVAIAEMIIKLKKIKSSGNVIKLE